MELSYPEIIVALVVFLFLFFALFLFSYKKGNKLSKNLLGIFFFTLGLAVADVYLFFKDFYKAYPHFAFWLNNLPLLYGPILWLLTKSVTIPSYKITKKEIIHFVPYLLTFLLVVFTYHIKSLEYKKVFMEHANDNSQLLNIVINITVLGLVIFYIGKSFFKIKSYRNEIKEQVSNVDKINLGWLEHTLLGFAVIIFGSIIIVVISTVVGESYLIKIILFLLLFIMLFFIMSTIVKGLNTDVLFDEKIETSPIESNVKNESHVDENKLNLLKTYMQESQAFLNPSLSLKDLATALDLSPRNLSGLINKGTNQSFFDFINNHRIRFAQEKMKHSKDDKLTILEVMYASGFNSKSSFNTAFKKHSGLTPTAWKKQYCQ